MERKFTSRKKNVRMYERRSSNSCFDESGNSSRDISRVFFAAKLSIEIFPATFYRNGKIIQRVRDKSRFFDSRTRRKLLIKKIFGQMKGYIERDKQ